MANFVYTPKIEEFRYSADVEYIQKALKELGHTISANDAKLAWLDHSDDYCAGWLCLPDTPQDILERILPYLKTTEPYVSEK